MTGMRRRVTATRRCASLMLAPVAALCVVAGPAEPAGAAITAFTLTPAAGPPGTLVHVRGHGCAPGVIGSSSTDFVTVTATTLGIVSRAPVRSDGTWEGSFTVPANGAGPSSSAPVTASCVSAGVASLTTIYAPQTFTVTAGSPTTRPIAPPTTARSPHRTVVIPGDTATVITVPPSGSAFATGTAEEDAAQPGSGREARARRRGAKTRDPEPATLQPAAIDARSAAGTDGGLEWLGWSLLLVLLLAASGASAFAWRARHPHGAADGDML